MDGLAAVLAVSLAGQATTLTTESRDLLPVTPGAVDIVRRGMGRSSSVQFNVRESYPATQSVAYIRDVMSQRGWTVVEVVDFRVVDTLEVPRWTGAMGAKRKRGSRGYVASYPLVPSKGHRWQGWWRNRSGTGAIVTIEYSCPMAEQGLHSVWARVSARTYGADEAEEQERARKQARDELCRPTGVRQLPGESSCGK